MKTQNQLNIYNKIYHINKFNCQYVSYCKDYKFNVILAKNIFSFFLLPSLPTIWGRPAKNICIN